VALAPAVLAFLYVWSLGGSEAKGDATALSQSVKNDLGPSTVDGARGANHGVPLWHACA
jgi:hypothetical protein